MANANAPRGVQMASAVSGNATGIVTRFYVEASDANPIYVGQPVVAAGGSDANGVASVRGMAAAGEQVIGVVVGFESTHTDPPYRLASTERYVHVAADPDLEFVVQEDSVGGAIPVADVMQTRMLTGFADGSDIHGISHMMIDSSSASGAGSDVVLLRLLPAVDNEPGDFARWVVKFNNHALRGNSFAGA